MAIMICELSVREDAKTVKEYEASQWRVISTFSDDIDVSQYESGWDVAVMLGNLLAQHLKDQHNRMGVIKILAEPAYTFGQTSATATIFFEGELTPKQIACMKVFSRCEWAEGKPVRLPRAQQ